MNLALAILPDPEGSFGPREPGGGAAVRRRDAGEHPAALRIDLLDTVLGELEQMLAVEGRPGMCGDLDHAHGLAARGIEGVELVAGREPDVPAVERQSMHMVDARKGSVLAEDFGG